tara:strand:+ start:1964 stop:2341 length:378 start_codon:yes stop_codon:yes gene_type:complete
MTNNVFVYGTLKRSHGNNGMLGDSEFLGTGCTRRKFALYEDGLPYLIDDPISPIGGEVYSVTDETLQRLDALEGHPDWYNRKKILVCIPATGSCIECWTYFLITKLPIGARLNKTGNYKRELSWK